MDWRVRQVLSMLEKDPARSWPLRQVAATIRLHPSYLGHLFKQERGQPYQDCLRELRLTKAQDLLKDWRLSIKHVARATGYAHPPSFVRAFRKQFGKTPSQYRKAILSRDRLRNRGIG